VYHNLETAEARVLLPRKVRHFPVLRSDVAASHESAEGELLPACVGVDEVPSNSLHGGRHDVSRSCYMKQCAAVKFPKPSWVAVRAVPEQMSLSAGSGSSPSGRDACMDTSR
jgi:hypothetical protein